MSVKKDGGPAFPANLLNASQGLSLRDVFAAAALSGCSDMEDASKESLSNWCYELADAMIEAREK